MQMTMNNENVKLNIKSKYYALDFLIGLFLALSTLFIGADKIGINAGVNFRLDQLFLVITSLLMIIRNRFKITKNKWIFLFLFFSLISTILSYSVTRGILFYLSIVYNVVFVFYLYSNFIKYYGPKKFMRIFRWTMYVQFLIVLTQFLLKTVFSYELSFLPSYGTYMGINRFSLWFYEPSYFATYVSIWFTIAFYMFLIGGNKGYIKDIIMALIMFIISTSTSGFIAIALSIFIIYLLWIKKRITVKKLLFLLIIVIIAMALVFIFKDIFDTFIGRIFNSSLDSASGGRITQWIETFEVFKEKPFFGVGPGNYGLYLNKGAGYVPSNVTLELMATLGIFATISFYGLSIHLSYKMLRIYRRDRRMKLYACVVLSLLVFTIVLQINQGYLRLYHWMLLGVMQGMILYYNKNYKVRSVNCYEGNCISRR